MQHIEAATIANAKSSCYRCGETSDLVDFDAFIEGEGVLVICTTCINDAHPIANEGRKRMRRQARKDADAARRTAAV